MTEEAREGVILLVCAAKYCGTFLVRELNASIAYSTYQQMDLRAICALRSRFAPYAPAI